MNDEEYMHKSVKAVSPDGESRQYIRKICESVVTNRVDGVGKARVFQTWIMEMLKEQVEAFKHLNPLQLNDKDVYSMTMEDLKNWVDGVDEKPQRPEIGEGSMCLLLEDDTTRHIIWGVDEVREFTPPHGRVSAPLITVKSPTYSKKNIYSIKREDIRDMVIMATKDVSFALNKYINRLFDNNASAVASSSKVYQQDDEPVKIGNNLVYPGFVRICISEPLFEYELRFGEFRTQLRMYMAIDTLDVRKITKA